MSTSITDEQSAWVSRVLGLAPGSEAAADPGSATAGQGAPAPLDWPAMREAFDQAVSTVDGQIAALQNALRASGDETLEDIAEFGMNGITGDHRVKLMAMMMELNTGGAAALRKTGPGLAKLAEDFKAYLDGDERVEVCDDNPFGVAVSIRATLGGALGRMAAGLRKGLGA